MSEFVERNRISFEFILFLFLAGITSAIAIAASGFLSTLGLGFFAAGSLIFGIFLTPIL